MIEELGGKLDINLSFVVSAAVSALFRLRWSVTS